MHKQLEMFSQEAGRYITQHSKRLRQPREWTSTGDTPMGFQVPDTEKYGPKVQNGQHHAMDPEEPYPAVWAFDDGSRRQEVTNLAEDKA